MQFTVIFCCGPQLKLNFSKSYHVSGAKAVVAQWAASRLPLLKKSCANLKLPRILRTHWKKGFIKFIKQASRERETKKQTCQYLKVVSTQNLPFSPIYVSVCHVNYNMYTALLSATIFCNKTRFTLVFVKFEPLTLDVQPSPGKTEFDLPSLTDGAGPNQSHSG